MGGRLRRGGLIYLISSLLISSLMMIGAVLSIKIICRDSVKKIFVEGTISDQISNQLKSSNSNITDSEIQEVVDGIMDDAYKEKLIDEYLQSFTQVNEEEEELGVDDINDEISDLNTKYSEVLEETLDNQDIDSLGDAANLDNELLSSNITNTSEELYSNIGDLQKEFFKLYNVLTSKWLMVILIFITVLTTVVLFLVDRKKYIGVIVSGIIFIVTGLINCVFLTKGVTSVTKFIVALFEDESSLRISVSPVRTYGIVEMFIGIILIIVAIFLKNNSSINNNSFNYNTNFNSRSNNNLTKFNNYK